jgi:hypothetical protein
MGQYQYRLNCELNVNPKNFVGVRDVLEISLPCMNCQRNDRTIIFEGINTEGICTPREKCDGFPGKLTSREIIKKSDTVEVMYLIDFEYEPFIDRKYNLKSSLPEFGWARLYFTLKCANCQKEKTISTQENIGRPWNERCGCGNIIYKDEESPFDYEVNEFN